MRWKIIGFIDAGKTQKEAANFYHIIQGAVSKILKKYKETNEVKSKKRPGGPLKLTEVQKAKICSLLSVPFATCEPVSKLMATEVQISHDLVRIVAKQRGFFFKKPKIIPKLNEENKQERLQYCNFLLSSNLSKFIFSDAAAFYLFRANKKHLMMKSNPLRI